MATERQALIGKSKEKGSTYLLVAIAISAMGAFGFGWSLGFTATIMASNKIGTDDADLLCPVYDALPNGSLALFNGTAANAGKMNCQLQLTDSFEFLMGAIINGGAMIGALGFGPVVDRFGKKTGMIIMQLLFAAGYAIIFLLPKPAGGDHWMIEHKNSTVPHGSYSLSVASNSGTIQAMLLIARLIIGIAVGISCCTIASYQMEISPTAIRGAVGTIFQIGITMGLVVSYILGSSLGWKLCALIPLIFSVVGAGLTIMLIESPVWLISKKKEQLARNNLQKLRDASTSGDELARILDSMRPDDDDNSGSGGFGELCGDPVNRKILTIGVVLMLVQQFSGINAIMFYSGTILQTVASSPEMANTYAIGMQCMQVVVTFASAFFMDRAGRKPILIFAASGMFLSSYLLAYYFVFGDKSTPEAVALVAFYGYVFFFGCGMGAIPWSILGEIFTPSIKGVASSICTAVNWSSSFIITFSLGYMVDGFQSIVAKTYPDYEKTHLHAGMGITFALYGTVALLGIVFVKAFIPETKGKSMAQIQAELRGTKSNYNSIN
eukprot:m.139599 g.139599  ORF g.139599 m.139599 type:complete len:552 (-) comp30069_c0_seq1:300-1955(-)